MKAIFRVEIGFKDDYVKNWKKNYVDWHKRFDGLSEEKILKMIKENKPLENSIACMIQNYLFEDGDTIEDCNITIEDESEMD